LVLDDKDDRQVLNYIALGGAIEIFTIVDSTMHDVYRQLLDLIGRSAAPPFYAMNVFHSSNAYSSLAQLKPDIQNYLDLSVALEGVMLTNYNKGAHNVFTVADSFNGLSDYLTSNNLKGVMGMSTAYELSSDAFKAAQTAKCLVGSDVAGSNLVGSLDQV